MKITAVAAILSAHSLLVAQTIDRTKPPDTPAIPSYKLPPITESKLPNGLSIVTAEDPRFPLVTVRLAFQAGSKSDPANLPGLSDSLATLLTQGTKTRTSRQIAEELASIGGTLTGRSRPDSLILAGSSLAENTSKLLSLLSDVVLQANFPESEVALQKQNRKQLLLAERSESAFLAREKMSEVLFGNHPYAHIAPTSESLDRMDQKAFVAFRDSYLTPGRAYLILIGKLPPHAELMKMIQDRFGSWAPKPVPAYSPAASPASKRQLILVDRPGSAQADIRVGMLSPTYKSAELFPLIVGSAILGGSADSRLFNDIREKRGYAYDAHTEFEPRQETGVFTSVTQVRNDVVEPAMQALFDDISGMSQEKVKADELTETKNYLSGLFLIQLEPQSGLADQLVKVKIMGLPNDYLEKYTTRIRSVEPDQIEAAAKKYMVPDKSAVVVVGDASKIQKSLEKFGPVKVTKANP